MACSASLRMEKKETVTSSNLPSIYLLRKASEPLPNHSDCEPGDVVVMHSGDIMVHNGQMWYLLPGRYLSPEQLKIFIRYIASGWPTDPSMVELDLGELGDKRFVYEVGKVTSTLVLLAK